MYIIYSGPDDRYATACTSRRTGDQTHIETLYLGRVLDKEAGIYKSQARGIFTFNEKTGEFGGVPEDYIPPTVYDNRKKQSSISVDFGDAFFLNEFLYSSGLMEVVDQIAYGNPDTLHCMVLFYILSGLANHDAIYWYEGSFAQLLYPRANLSSQRLSDFLASIGTPEKQMTFQKAYIRFILEHYNPDRNILIDSSGLPNSIHFPLTEKNVHNGKVSNEIRLIFVVQRSTGLPLYYQAVPGNIVDVSTLSRIFLHLDSLGVDISSCIMDAGYNSADNLDLFYDENHQCRIGFITRVASKDKTYKQMIREELATLDCEENLIQYEDRFLFIKKREVRVGSHKDQPAWMYLGLDCNRMSDEQHKLLKRAVKESLPLEDVYCALQTGGLFGILSGNDYTCEEILPAYYQRQAAEQIFDFAKNYTKLLPLRTNTEATFRGHLLLSYVASCAVKMIQLQLKEANLYFGSRLACLRNQKCTIFPGRVIIDVPQKEANDTYKAFQMKCPDAFPIQNGILSYSPPTAGSLAWDSNKRKRGQKETNIGQNKKPAKRGRPLGSKNKKTMERESAQETQCPKEKRGRGRPKGSKNKATLEREAKEAAEMPVKRGPGRPKGSKNKKTLQREAEQSQQQ